MKTRWNTKISGTAIGLVLALILSFSLILPVLGASPTPTPTPIPSTTPTTLPSPTPTPTLKSTSTTAPTPSPVTDDSSFDMVKGKISSIDEYEQYFDVLTVTDGIVTVNVNSKTIYCSVSGTASAMRQIKIKVQTEIKDKKLNTKKTQDSPSITAKVTDNLTTKNSSSPTPTKAQSPTPTATPVIPAVSLNYEEDPIVQQILSINADAKRGFFGWIKSWFNHDPKLGKKAVFSDIAVGDGVVIEISPDEDVAKQVLIIKALDLTSIEGNIVAVTATSCTIKPYDSSVSPVTLNWDKDSQIIIEGDISVKTGQSCRAVYAISDKIIKQFYVYTSGPAAKP
jgi:hypothetical protein